MRISGEDIGQWILPGIISVAIHAGILALFLGTRGCGGPGSPVAEPPPAAPAAAASTDPVSPVTVPSTEEKPKPETRTNPPDKKVDAAPRAKPKPRTDPKPKARPEPKARPKTVTAPDPKSLDDLVEKPGQELVPEKPSTAAASPAPSTPVPASDAAVYTVKPGDNFTHIARDHGCTPEELAKFNGKDRKHYNVIRVGDKIKVPKKGE